MALSLPGTGCDKDVHENVVPVTCACNKFEKNTMNTTQSKNLMGWYNSNDTDLHLEDA
jgi:hypothetical protein